MGWTYLLRLAFLLAGPPADAPVADFSLIDTEGAEIRLSSAVSDGLVVLVFVGVDCPMSRRYAPRLEELWNSYRGRGVKFIGVSSSQQDSAAEVARFGRDFKLTFPLLRDPTFKAANIVGAERTPEAFLIDRDLKIRYRGRIDDQFRPDEDRAGPEQQDLVVAIEEVLSGRSVSRPKTEPIGCRIGRTLPNANEAEVVWHGDVASIFREHCSSCHRAGGIGPFPLSRYEDTEGWGVSIREVVQKRSMPPWHATSGTGRFANATDLSDSEIKRIVDWVNQGCAEGDSSKGDFDVPKSSNWQLPKDPDLEVFINETEVDVPESGPPNLRNFVVETRLDSSRLAGAIEIRPSNRKVVQHASVYAIPPGLARAYPSVRNLLGTPELLANLIAWYSPDCPPRIYPEDMARELPAGSKLLFQILYRPTGRAERDRTSVGLVWADPAKATRLVRTIPIAATQLTISSGRPIVSVKRDRSIDEELYLLSMVPRMSSHGRSVRLDRRGGSESALNLLDVPQFSYYWQHEYRLREPVPLMPGSTIACSAEFSAPSLEPTIAVSEPAVNIPVDSYNEEVIAYLEVVGPYIAPVRVVAKQLLDPAKNVSTAIAGLAVTTLVCLLMLSLKPTQSGPEPAVAAAAAINAPPVLPKPTE